MMKLTLALVSVPVFGVGNCTLTRMKLLDRQERGGREESKERARSWATEEGKVWVGVRVWV